MYKQHNNQIFFFLFFVILIILKILCINIYILIQKMSKQRLVDNFDQKFEQLGYINKQRTVLLARSKQKQNPKTYIVKTIHLGPSTDNKNVTNIPQSMLKRLYGSSLPMIHKPDNYSFVQRNKHFFLYLISHILELSLQSIILYHRKRNQRISPSLTFDFGSKIYDMLVRIKNVGDSNHKNLKPSNIFLTLSSDGQIQWKITQYGLMTNYPNKYYQLAGRDQARSKTNISFINQQYQGDLFSLAVILVEMMTLSPINKIYYNLRKQGSFRQLQGFQMAKTQYGEQMIDFIYQLMSPKDNIKDVYRKFRDNPPQYKKIPKYQQIKMNQQRCRRIIQDRPYQDSIQKFRKQVQYTGIAMDDVIKKAEQYDPDLQFHFFDYKPMMLFLHDFHIDFSQDKLINLCFYMRSLSAMNYVQIIKYSFPPRALIQSVIKRAIVTYDTRRQFFEAQAGGSQYWKAQDIHKFLESLGIYIQDQKVMDLVTQWNGTKATSIQYKQFNKIYRNVGEQDASNLRSNNKTNRNDPNEKRLSDLLIQLNNYLKQQGKNIVGFFRLHDKTGKWYVDDDIQDQIRKKVKIPQKQLKELFQDMWKVAGQTNKKGKVILNYITLIKRQMKDQISLYQLFKMILVQKINQVERKQFYEKYEKDGKGWNKYSLISFSQDELLQFDERQLNSIFNTIDEDKSGYMCEKQLMFRLTGLKQFDKDFAIEKIKQELGPGKKWDLFQVFVRFDENKDLLYDSPAELVQVFGHLGIDIPPEHCISLFTNGMTKSKKFPYLTFLRYFLQIKDLFVKTCIWCIERFYSDKFDTFYDLGRIQNKKKWTRQSLAKINQQLILGFKSDQIGQIWDSICHGEQALTRQQIAQVFNAYCPPEEDILPINSSEKSKNQPSKLRNTKSINQKDKQQQKTKQTTPSNNNKGKNDGKQVNELADQIFQMKLTDVALCMIRKSKQNGQLNYHQFCQCLDELKIKYVRGAPMKSTRRFQRIDDKSDTTIINFFNYLMYICQLKQENKQMRKTECLAVILKQLMRFYNKSVQEVFSKCRKAGMMRLSEYENFIRDMIKTQIYFDDIQDTWKFWGQPQYLTPEDFKKILNAQTINQPKDKRPQKMPLNRQFSFAQQQNIRQSTGQESVESPYFAKRMGRKQSQDRKQQVKIDKEKQWDMQKNKREKQRQRQRGQKQRQKQREKQREREWERQKERQREKQREKNNISGQASRKQKQQYNTGKDAPKSSIQDRTQKQNTKGNVIQKFEESIKQKGSQKLNNLFSKSNSVSPQFFANFVEDNYDMSALQCEKLAQALSSFGKIKIQTIKKYIRKLQSPKKVQKQDQKRFLKPDAKKKQPMRKGEEKGKNLKQESPQNQNLRLQDPRKTKINVPLVRQHIKILVSSFAKKFDVTEIQPYFFQGNTVISKQDFISKCMSINSAISKAMYQKIFVFLKPKTGFVSSIDFNLNFALDKDNIQIDETYLPQEIENQIKTAFQKSDKDKSGYIQIPQIQILLGSLGFNQTQKQIQNYFQKIDQNFDKKISLKQFRTFIQQNILPYVSDFDEDVDALNQLLKMNDVFRTGYLPVSTIGAILERYGVKIGQKDLQALNRGIANQNGQISIKQFINILYYPSQPNFQSNLKSVLYRIRWRRKITLKQIQKIFQNISTCFVNSYTSMQIKHKILRPSTFITPILNQSRLFYNDFYYKNFNKIDQKSPNLISEMKQSDLIVQIKMIDAYGIPIPQNQTIKSQILNRSVNIIFYDTSIQQGKDCITNLQIQFDVDVQDQWVFNKNNRSVFVKIGNYQMRKYQKIFILFQFVVTLVDGTKCLDISCGTASFPVKQLLVDSKTTRKYKIIAGLPNKSKQIDKMSVSKRKGWRGIIGTGQVDSQFQIQILPSSKFQDKLPYICSLPQKSIINRKSLHLFYIFREYFAYRCVDNKKINPDMCYHFIIKTFLLCLDVPDVYEQLYQYWKQKIQTKISNLQIGRRIFQYLMQDLSIVMNSKQFQILPSYPSKSTLTNKNLRAIRKKLLQEVFNNIEFWVNNDVMAEYRRKKTYGVDTMPFKIEERELNEQVRVISEQIVRAR